MIPREQERVPLLKRLGPGLITGAADDDPSGIATYSRTGAQYGYGLLWSVLLTTPLVIGIQIFANTINIAADLGAMGNALQMLAGGVSEIYIVFFALLSLTLQIFVPFPRYAPLLKWMTLALPPPSSAWRSTSPTSIPSRR